MAKRGVITPEQASRLAQTLLELVPVYGSGESVLQLITGQSSLTGEEASRIWAAVGLVPIAGGMVRKVGEPAVEALTSALKVVIQQKVLLQQEERIGELAQLFSRQNSASSVTISGKSYIATMEGNLNGTTKVFDTTSTSAVELERQVFTYARELAAGQPFKAVDQGVWTVKLSDGTTINVRSICSSGVGRWTEDMKDVGALESAAGKKPGTNFELKFK